MCLPNLFRDIERRVHLLDNLNITGAGRRPQSRRGREFDYY
jgi:hypothetical protein